VKLIVADSGPLIVLVRAGLLNVVREIAGDILVPEVVFSECTRETEKHGAAAISGAVREGLFSVVGEALVDNVPRLRQVANLGAGELAAIALALDRNCPVLMDERLGRNVATLNRLTVVGSVGLLVAAKRRGLIEAVGPILSMWSSWGYFLSPKLIEATLSAADEIPGN
jgi:predicted nucleic acid-binding protein